MLYQVTAPHYCAGFFTEAGIIVRAAPILAWAVGKTLRQVSLQLRKRGYKVQFVSA